jgi:hypothetical protein
MSGHEVIRRPRNYKNDKVTSIANLEEMIVLDQEQHPEASNGDVIKQLLTDKFIGYQKLMVLVMQKRQPRHEEQHRSQSQRESAVTKPRTGDGTLVGKGFHYNKQ